MAYKTIIPADGWYFSHQSGGTDSKPVVYQIAAWALTDQDEVVGLVPVVSPQEGAAGGALGGTSRAKLTTPPPVPGHYLHREQLTEEELKAATTMR
jgi:hypothetical protein